MNVEARARLYRGGLDTSDPTQQTFSRASYATREQLNNWTFDNQLTGTVQHRPDQAHAPVRRRSPGRAFDRGWRVRLGAVAQRLRARSMGRSPCRRRRRRCPDPFGGFTRDVDQRQQGIYAQDQMALGGLRVRAQRPAGLGARRTDRRRLRNTTRSSPTAPAALYTTPFGLAPYASYSTSFEPQAGADARGPTARSGIADPSLGKQIEAGAKYSVPGHADPAHRRVVPHRPDQRADRRPADLSSRRRPARSARRGSSSRRARRCPYGFNARVAYSRQRVKVTRGCDDPVRVGTGARDRRAWRHLRQPRLGAAAWRARRADDRRRGASCRPGLCGQ